MLEGSLCRARCKGSVTQTVRHHGGMRRREVECMRASHSTAGCRQCRAGSSRCSRRSTCLRSNRSPQLRRQAGQEASERDAGRHPAAQQESDTVVTCPQPHQAGWHGQVVGAFSAATFDLLIDQFQLAHNCAVLPPRRRTGTAREAAEGAVGVELEDALARTWAALAAAEVALIARACIAGRAAGQKACRAGFSRQLRETASL